MSLTYAFAHSRRLVFREPIFATVSVSMLALAVGVTTAMFSIVDAVLLRPLPFPNASHVVAVGAVDARGRASSTAWPDFETLRGANHTFAALAAYYHRAVNLTGIDQPEQLQALVVSSDFFGVLGTRTALGRPFTPDDEQWGRHRVALLSDGMWREEFGSDPNILARTVTLNGEPYSIIGVLPRGFWFMGDTDRIVVPLSFAPDDSRRTRANHFLSMIGRLRSESMPAAAAADLTSIARGIPAEGREQARAGFAVTPLQEVVVSNVRTGILVLSASVAVLLLIGCINLVGMMLTRAVSRRKRMAIRLALGATRGRLAGECLAEAATLAALGGALGVVLASLAIEIVRSLSPTVLPRASAVHIDGRVLLFAAIVSVLTALAIGVAPVWSGVRTDIAAMFKEEGHGSGTGRAHTLARSLLVVAQSAFAMVLLVGGALMMRTLVHLTHVELGFDPHHVLTFSVNLPPARYLDSDVHPGFAPAATRKADDYLRGAIAQLRGIPGVESAGATALLPASGLGWDKVLTLWDRPLPPTIAQLPQFEYRPVSGDYFRAMGIRLVRGREIDDHDTLASALVAVVNEEFVRRNFDGRADRALGTRISVNPPKKLLPAAAIGPDTPTMPAQFTIVGVVGDARNASVTEPASPMVYCPYSQGAEATLMMSFVVRTADDPAAIVVRVRRAMSLVDPNQPLANIRTMDDALASSIGRPTVETQVLGTFGMIALALAAFGIYALVAFAVAQRTRELGIRIALGAQPRSLGLAVVGQGVGLALIGVILGSGGAMLAARAMHSMVFGIGVLDPAVFLAVGALLLVMAALAAAVPAIRVTRVDPLVALR